MPFLASDLDAILAAQKRVDGDILWQEDQDHSPNREFRVSVEADTGAVLTVVGGYNPRIPAVSYSLISPEAGRIYGLCLGKDHHNPCCTRVGDKHRARAIELGVNDYLGKPYQDSQLLDAIRRQLEDKGIELP